MKECVFKPHDGSPPPDLLACIPVTAKAHNGHAALVYDSALLSSSVNIDVDVTRNAAIVIALKPSGNLCSLHMHLQKNEALVLVHALVSAIKSMEVK